MFFNIGRSIWLVGLVVPFLTACFGSFPISDSENMLDLPSPKIHLLGANSDRSLGQPAESQYWLGVENWEAYPIGIFLDPSSSYFCPDTSYTGRVVVQIRSGVEEYPLALYCDLLHPRHLRQLSFYMPNRLSPQIFLFMWDTSTGMTWISNRISLPRKAP